MKKNLNTTTGEREDSSSKEKEIPDAKLGLERERYSSRHQKGQPAFLFLVKQGGGGKRKSPCPEGTIGPGSADP